MPVYTVELDHGIPIAPSKLDVLMRSSRTMARSVATYGIYPSMSALHSGAEALKADGFRQTDISVLYSDRLGVKHGARDAHTGPLQSHEAGAASYVNAGSVLGYLAGIGALTLPGIGPLLAAGPLVNSFSDLSAASAPSGLIGAFVGLGLTERDAQRYEDCLKDGGILLSVYCDDVEWAGRARNILAQTGAEHLSATAELESAYPS